MPPGARKHLPRRNWPKESMNTRSLRIRQTIAKVSFLLGIACVASWPHVTRARTNHREASDTQSQSEENCYDPHDSNDIRLWDGVAPGAAGNDPCRDIPFLRLFPGRTSESSAHSAIIVIPGGGYDHLSDRKEQEPIADYFSRELGVTTFVLYYRLVQRDGTYRYPVPMWDAQRALKLVRYRSSQFSIDPSKIGLFGFSAGGHLAATIALHAASNFDLPTRDGIDSVNAHPNFLGLGYPVISMLPDQYASPNSLKHLLDGYKGREKARLEQYLSAQLNVPPRLSPVFLFESMDDKQISSENSVMFAQALREAGTPAEVHLFPHGVHGAGLANGIPDEEEWPGMFRSWMAEHGFVH